MSPVAVILLLLIVASVGFNLFYKFRNSNDDDKSLEDTNNKMGIVDMSDSD